VPEELNVTESEITTQDAATAAEGEVSGEIVQSSEGEAAADAEGSSEEGAYEIEGRKFKTQAEAFAFAKSYIGEVKVEQAVADAYRQGLQEAAQLVQPVQNVTKDPAREAEEDAAWQEKFYSDPKKTLKEFAESIRAEVRKEVLGEVSTVTAEEKLWQEFYSQNPDLEDFKGDVEGVLKHNQEAIAALARTKGKTEAMRFLANKTRAKFEAYMEKAKPGRALPNTKQTATPGTQTNVTPAKQKEQALDFASQVRKLRESRR